MSEWFKPDDRWRMFGGVKTRKEFLDRYVIESRFHNDVPEEVIESYKTAQYVMAHAYYHWPMYDEAYKKLLGIFEMSIKMRAVELGIDIKKSEGKPKDLGPLINQMFKPSMRPELNRWSERIRFLRNSFFHPTTHSYGGGLLANGAIIDLINLVNMVFHQQDIFRLAENQTHSLKVKLNTFTKKGCLNLKEEGKTEGFFIHSFKLIETVELDKRRQWLIAYKYIEQKVANLPIGYSFISLSEMSISEDTIFCVRKDGTKFIIGFAVLPFELMMVDVVKKQIEALDNDSKTSMKVRDHYDLQKGLSLHRYNNYWV